MAKKKDDAGGLAFIGFLMLGIAAGILFNQTAAGTMAGLGFGFLAMAFIRTRK